MVDKVKPLKIENPATGGTENNWGPTESDPTEDHLAVKGIALENSDNTLIYGNSGVMTFKDTQVTTPATLRDAVERLKLKDVDLAAIANGYVLAWDAPNNKFIMKAVVPAAGPGVVPPFVFNKQGSAGVGTYLRVGEALTSVTGQLIVGTNTLVKMSVSNKTAVGSNTVVQLQTRNTRTTFSDLAGGSITIASGQYKATSSALSVSLSADIELCAYVKSGVTLSNPVLCIYIIPA